MSTRRAFLGRTLATAAVAALAACGVEQTRQQTPKRIPRVGTMVMAADLEKAQRVDDAFRSGLRDHGYVDGETILLEWRHQRGEGDWDEFAAEFVAMPVDVIVAPHLFSLQAAARATMTIPIVAAMDADPVSFGLVESLARPGRNVTGIATSDRSLGAKLLELLRQIAPSARLIAILWGGPYTARPGMDEGRIGVYEAAPALGVTVFDLVVRSELDRLLFALDAATRRGVDALIVPGPSTYATKFKGEIAAYALDRRIPLVAAQEQWVEAGALVAFGVDRLATYRRLAYFVDRILKGTKPGDIPIEQPEKFETVLNLKAAKALGLTVPQSVMSRATRVIE